jgi:hypothetical protein
VSQFAIKPNNQCLVFSISPFLLSVFGFCKDIIFIPHRPLRLVQISLVVSKGYVECFKILCCPLPLPLPLSMLQFCKRASQRLLEERLHKYILILVVLRSQLSALQQRHLWNQQSILFSFSFSFSRRISLYTT